MPEAAPGASTGIGAGVRVGWCSKSIGMAAAPFAIALQKGWFAAAGLTLDLVPAGGSSACAAGLASGDLAFALPSVEAAAALRAQGVKVKNFYTAYQSNVYGMAVPVDSAVNTLADLKGKRIGVVSPASASAIIARLLVRDAHLDAERDISLVPAGDARQTAALLTGGGLDALSLFDTHYAMVERAGVKLRRLPPTAIDHFPSSGFLALEDTLRLRRQDAVALARGYAMGTIYAAANPEQAVRSVWQQWPATRPPAADDETALGDGVAMLMARIPAWQLDRVGAKQWGEHIEKHYAEYLKWLLAHAFITQTVAPKDLLTSELLKDINAFDAAAVVTSVVAAKP